MSDNTNAYAIPNPNQLSVKYLHLLSSRPYNSGGYKYIKSGTLILHRKFYKESISSLLSDNRGIDYFTKNNGFGFLKGSQFIVLNLSRDLYLKYRYGSFSLCKGTGPQFIGTLDSVIHFNDYWFYIPKS